MAMTTIPKVTAEHVGANVKLEMASDGSVVSGRVFAIDGTRIILEEEEEAVAGEMMVGEASAAAASTASSSSSSTGSKRVGETSSGATPTKGVRIVSGNSIKTITLLVGDKPAATPALPPLSKEQALRREKFSSRQYEEALLRSGHSEEALRIFKVLAKTFDVEWFGNGIRVKDLEVTLKDPYRTNDIVGTNVRAVERVREIVRLSRTAPLAATGHETRE